MHAHETVSLRAATDLSKKHNILLILFSSKARCVNHTGIASPVRHILFFSVSPPPTDANI